MSSPGRTKYDLSWRRNNVAALIVLTCLGAGWLAAAGRGAIGLAGTASRRMPPE